MIDYALVKEMCDVSGSLLLERPSSEFIAHVNQAMESELTLKESQQAFFDYFILPQSGLFCPPFEHVCKQAEPTASGYKFPMAQHDGGQDVEAIYGQFGFSIKQLQFGLSDLSQHIPGDHFGLMLIFLGRAVNHQNWAENAESRQVIKLFIEEHIPHIYFYTQLLKNSQSEYIQFCYQLLIDTAELLQSLIAGVKLS